VVVIANNKLIDNGAETDFTIATDEISGIDWQYVKIAYGADGVATIVEAGTGLPVDAGLTLVDMDTGGGTVSRPAVGIYVPASGGPVLVPGDGTYGLKTQITTMPAAARTTDAVAAGIQTDAIMNGLAALTPKFFSETVTASDTDEELVAAVALKKIRVLALAVQCGGTATDITFESTTTTRKHKVPAGANGGQILPFNPVGWFETAAGESLTCTTGTGSSVEISGVYVEV